MKEPLRTGPKIHSTLDQAIAGHPTIPLITNQARPGPQPPSLWLPAGEPPGPPPAARTLPYAVTLERDGRGQAVLDLVSGATTVTIRPANLG